MDQTEGQPKFEIQAVIEQKPFAARTARSFFSKWCEINSSIQPEFIDRETWEARNQEGILEERSGGKQVLFIPKDLHLWEMIGVMEAIDNSTFAAKLERRTEAKEKLLKLGKNFQDAGAYIAQRLGGINEGKGIAEALALEFYGYGQSLISGKKPKDASSIEEIAARELTPEELEATDRFLTGESLYKSRQKRAKNNLEKERQKTLAQFFRLAEKAFTLTKRSELHKPSTRLKPWQSDAPIHAVFLERVEKAVTQKIKTPERELTAAVFRRGLERLASEMRETTDMHDERTGEITPGWKRALNKFLVNIGLDPIIEQKRLMEVLEIPKLRNELKDIHRSGDSVQISTKEREIADKIQRAVSDFPYQEFANSPAKMIAKKYVNCVGASMLGGALMKEVGLRYLVADAPDHSVILLITNDGEVELRDMGRVSGNVKLKDEMIKKQKEDGSLLAVKDIVAFSLNPSPKGLRFDVISPVYRIIFPWVQAIDRPYLTVFGPEHGEQAQVLGNTANTFWSILNFEKSTEGYRRVIATDPNKSTVYFNLGLAFYAHSREKEAIKFFRQALVINPKFADAYYELAQVFQSYKRYQEAAETYREFIGLADENRDKRKIKRAKRMIAKLAKRSN
ncbi:MAG: tetratricopeptide repeat protein [Candidatus Shapirobacteria bacterium]